MFITLITLVICFNLCCSIRDVINKHKNIPKHLLPQILKTELTINPDYELEPVYLKGDPNYILLNFHHNTDKSDPKNQILYVWKDGEISLTPWKITIDEKAVYVDEFVAINNILFGVSRLGQQFFYVDNKSNIFSVQTYNIYESVIPSDFEPSYIYKLTAKDITVSQNLL
ncbi:hypothetical protein RF11_16347 [Thelohanellus kitauei]|uniref:Uncharacterized protein n=1 Tax=Thelohanellus kitauei TaxID=669202 RepID=A0A0C2M976_THEKT|nr:hypothetical protein RF11_16347 [Thelohanellus kitauei]